MRRISLMVGCTEAVYAQRVAVPQILEGFPSEARSEGFPKIPGFPKISRHSLQVPQSLCYPQARTPPGPAAAMS